jgi:hypothetical protein
MTVRFHADEAADNVVLKAEGVLDSTDEIGIKLRTKTNTVSVAYDKLIDGVVQLPW